MGQMCCGRCLMWWLVVLNGMFCIVLSEEEAPPMMEYLYNTTFPRDLSHRKEPQQIPAEHLLTSLQNVSVCNVQIPLVNRTVQLYLQIAGLELKGGLIKKTGDSRAQRVFFVTIPIVSFNGWLGISKNKLRNYFVATAFSLSVAIPVELKDKQWTRTAGKSLKVQVQRVLIGVNETNEDVILDAVQYLRGQPQVLFPETEGCVGDTVTKEVFHLMNDGRDTSNDSWIIISRDNWRTKRQAEVECSNGVDNFLDEVLKGAQNELQKADPLSLGEVNDIVLLHDGTLEGLSTVHRSGLSSSSCADTKVNIEAPLAATNLNLRYFWKKKILFMNLDGTLQAKAGRLGVTFRVTLETSTGFNFLLDGSEVTDLRDFDVKVTGFGPLNILFRLIVKLVNAVCKSTVKNKLSDFMYRALKKEVDNLSFSYD